MYTTSNVFPPFPLGLALLFATPRHQPLALDRGWAVAPKKKVKNYPIDCLHIDLAGVHIKGRRVYLFVVIDRTRHAPFAGLLPRATKMLTAEFLRRVLTALFDKIRNPSCGLSKASKNWPGRKLRLRALEQFQGQRTVQQAPHSPGEKELGVKLLGASDEHRLRNRSNPSFPPLPCANTPSHCAVS